MSKQKLDRSTPKPNDAMLKASFLEQAARILISHSTNNGDVFNSLSKAYIRELRETKYVEQLKLHYDWKRNYCQKCLRLWHPDKSGKAPLQLRRSHRKMWRKCMDCGDVKGFVPNSNYKSRNEKLVESDE